MLISALCEYYEILSALGQVLPEGYSRVKIHYLVGLTPEGTIGEIIDFQERTLVQKGKGKTQQLVLPRTLTLPKRTEKPGIDGNIAEHRPVYLFGLNWDADHFNPQDKTEKAKKSHQCFVEAQLAFLEGLDSPLINAYRAFVTRWNPAEEVENPHLLPLGKAYATAGFAFCLSGNPNELLHDDPVFHSAWEARLAAPGVEAEVMGQCAVTGRLAPMALIHDKVKGFPGGSSMGNALISFNSASVESYGKAQSYNSNLSKQAMRNYTEALNALVTDRARRAKLDDVVVLHWAISRDAAYDKLVNAAVFFDSNEDEEDSGADAAETNQFLLRLLQEAQQAIVTGERLDITDRLDPTTSFYMVGLKPNSARLAVEFVYHNQFGTLFQNIAQHQVDMRMREDRRPIPLWRIKKELVNPHSSQDAIDPALLSRLLESIFNGYRYPEGLLATVVRRIKSDSDSEENTYIKLNPMRVGIIKGFLNRSARLSGNKEEYTMSLNRDNTDPAYLCGRLFAVLEKAQLDAAGQDLNRTIKDAHFASACSTPAVVFPKLMRLAQHHMAKGSYGGYWNYLVGEITGKLDGEFPKTLTLHEQGTFILGYYHQYWAKKETPADTADILKEETL